MKSAYVTPILKKAGMDSADPTSYRPISNLSVLSKLLERLVSQQLVAYTLKTMICCQTVSRLTEHITRQKLPSLELCLTFC